MATHLDRWAARSLTSPEQWEAALVGSHVWLDFAPRNQALMLSYGIDGPAAGAETWRLIPSTEPGRECAVRAGEHGFPIRVPITTSALEPDPFVGGTRPTRSHVDRWEWRPVFGVEQLARRPAVGMLTPHVVPDLFTGAGGDAEFAKAVNAVATATVRGKLKSSNPNRTLADAAGRLQRSADRPELIPVLREQVAWLVAERVGHASTESPPSFDPSLLRPRERWERLVDVLDPARRLTASLGAAIGVDLVRSSIPRMQIVDDRVVPAGRRHRIPAATFGALPVGTWVNVGPYTSAEWLARGELGSGKGAFMRLNQSAYVVAVEHGDHVSWRLEDIASRTGHGRLANGISRDLASVRDDVGLVLSDRYPALDRTLTETHIARSLPMVDTPTRLSPLHLDAAVAHLADSGDYTRERLLDLIGDRFTDADRSAFVSAEPTELVRLVVAAGVTAASTVAVLRAEDVPASTVAGLLPTIGVPMSESIRALHARWEVPRVEAARLVAATGNEMRAAGCTPAEILAYRPESVFDRLPAEPHLWELAAATMATDGQAPSVIVSHLVHHAPTAECFATGLVAAVDGPSAGLGLGSQLHARPEYLAASAERYGLSPTETAAILRREHAPLTQVVATLGHLCDFDDAAVSAAWQGRSTPEVVAAPPDIGTRRITSIGGTEIGTAAELLAMLTPRPLPEMIPDLFELLALPTADQMEVAKP